MAWKSEMSALVLRIVLGATFIVHGSMKFSSGISNIAGWFQSIGLPSVLAYGVATVELIGGIAILLGLGTKVVAALLALVMAGAIVKVKLAAGFTGNGQGAGWELELALLAMAISLLVTGGGTFSVDSMLRNKREVQASRFV
ncbi:DoxX family protein [Ectobacillus ponti]|uniref:DoxX family protein n=1 Tax=Ectobacillus ponti TaxID=2961894 RepID=A0AA41XAS2_9BACI|nr:DoxX family protein [Ectobacillus ponti]MCP8969413.1 DoxX family protein [Ectobacillus ponti]